MTAQCPDALVCDMAEVYHVLDWRALGLPLAATLAAGLRGDSRSQMALCGAAAATDTLLLARMADALQLLLWAKTVDGQHGRNRPPSMVEALLGAGSERSNAGFADVSAYEAARARILEEK